MCSELPEETKEKFENLIATAMAKAHIPGLSVAMVKDDQVIYARGFGARNLKNNLPATPNTLYGIGSTTKSFTALAIMQLAEQRKLDVHDPVKKHIPEFKIENKENPIRIRHLLTHSSGIPNLGVAGVIIDRLSRKAENEKYVPMSSMNDLFLHINAASEEVAAEPGKRFFYFNSGYTLLGEIVERASKMKYQEYVKQKILKPLKMNRSTFLKEDFEKDPDVMTPYIVEGKEGKVKVTPTTPPFHKFVYGPGGLLSSVMELSNYLVANMNAGTFGETKILEESLLQEMHKIHIETEMFRSFYGDFGREGYGYGWMIAEDFLGHKLVTHGGSTGVSSAHFSFVPDLKIGIVESANAGGGPDSVLLGGLALLMGKDPMKEIPFFEIEKKLNMLAGEYESYKGLTKVSVAKKGAFLHLESKEMELSVPLIPETEKIENLKFYTILVPPGKMPIEFEVKPSGKIDLYIERNRLHKIGG